MLACTHECVCVSVCYNKKYQAVHKKLNPERRLKWSLHSRRSVPSLFQAARGLTGLISSRRGQRGRAPSGYANGMIKK